MARRSISTSLFKLAALAPALALALIVGLTTPVIGQEEALVFQPSEPGRLDFSFPTGSVKEIYSSLGEAFGFEVLFDAKLKDDRIAIEMRGVDAREALGRLAQEVNHFVKPVGERIILVAEDTPRNRREYTELAVKTWVLAHAEVKDVDQALRSIIEARRLTTSEELGMIMLRDTAEKIQIADRLVGLVDRPHGEVEIELQILELAADRLDAGLDRIGEQRTGSPSARYRLSADEFQQLVGGSRIHNLPNLSLVAGGKAEFSSFPLRGSLICASIYGRPVSNSDQITLELHTSIEYPAAPGQDQSQRSPHRMTSSMRLQAGQTQLVKLPPLDTDDSTCLVLALRATIIQVAEYDPSELDPIWVGTESRVHTGGRWMMSSRHNPPSIRNSD